MTVNNVGSWSGTWFIGSSSPSTPVNASLNIPVTGITGGNWLIATVGWYAVPEVPSSISVGDDAANYWVPLVTSPTDPLSDSFALNGNWNFATGATTPWTLTAGSSLAISSSTVYGSDAYSAQVVPNGSSATAAITSNRAVVQLHAGQPISASAYARFTQAVTSAFSLVISFYNSSGTLISSVTGTAQSAAANTWTQATNTTIAPSATVFAALTVQLTGTPAATNVFNVARAALYSPEVLNYNPFFTNTPALDGWQATGATAALATNVTFNGMPAISLTPTGLSSNVSLQATSGNLAPVVGNNYYVALGWALSPTGYDQASVSVIWYDSSKTSISTVISSPVSLTPDGWSRVSTTNLRAPATARYASTGFYFSNNPRPWDFLYVADMGIRSSYNSFSSQTRCSIWAAPNVSSATTRVFVQPLGQVQGISATVSEYSGMPQWLTLDTATGTYVTESSVTSLTVTPTQNDLVVATGVSIFSNTWTLDRVSLSGWAPHFWEASANGLASSSSSFEVASWQTTSTPATSTFYGVDPLNSNPVFASGVTTWTSTNATLVSSSAFSWPYSGINPSLVSTKSALLTPNGTSASCNAFISAASAPIANYGSYYSADFYVYSPTGWSNYQLAILWLNSSGTSIATTTGPTFSVPANTWTNTVLEGMAPSGAFSGSPVLIQNGTPPTSAVTYIGRGTYTAANAFFGYGQAQAMAAIQLSPTTPSVINANWPTLKLEVAFGQSASTTPDQLQWTDISNRVLSVNIQRGRQYELNALQTGTANFRLRNDDGYLTPGNSLSPYNCQVYNPIRVTAVWQNKIYGVFRGYMERWPQVWSDPHWGEVNAIGVDSYALFSKTLQSMVQEEILLDEPFGYWPCNDNSASAVALNLGSEATKTPLAISLATNSVNAFNGKFGDSSLGYGGTNYATSPLSSVVNTDLGQALVYGGLGVPVQDNLPAQPPGLPTLGGQGVTIIMFTGLGPLTNGATGQVAGHISLFTAIGRTNPIFEVWLDSTHTLWLSTWNVQNGGRTDISTADGPFDSARNTTAGTSNDLVFALTIQQGSFTLYANDPYNFANITTASDTIQESWNQFSVAGRVDPYIVGASYGYMAVNNIAIYDRVLPRTRLAAIMKSKFGAINDYGDFRVDRFLSYQQPVPARVYYDVRSAQTQLTGSYDQAGLNIGSAIGNVVASEAAFSYIDRNGYYVYRTRQNATDRGIQAVFGENTAAGELPYLVTLEIDYDPSYVYNDVQVNYIGSPNAAQTQALSGTVTRSTDSTSVNQYGDRSVSVSQYVQQFAQVANLGNYLLNQYKQPMLRVAQVALTPTSRPTMFSQLLALDIGDRITLNRRPIGANAISLNVTIIGVMHDIDWATGKWTISFNIMPESVAALQTVTLTFDVATLDVLDDGNVIGW